MSDFGSLRIALSSMYAAQKGLEITGHNIANAKSEGYSRQTVVTTADGGPSIAAMYARWQAGGYGVKDVFVERVNDLFLTNRTYVEHGANGAAQSSKALFGQLEEIFPEPGPSGIQQTLTEFWSSWDDVANQPADRGARSALLSRANVLMDKLRQSSSSLHAVQDNATTKLGAVVNQINNLTAQIGSLNSTIVSASAAGRAPADLEDKRDLLVRQLSDLVDLTVRYDDDGQVDLFIPAGPILMGSSSTPLSLAISPSGVSVQFASGAGGSLSFGGGEVKGLLDGINEIIPTFLTALDRVANSVRDTVNAGIGVFGGGLAVADQDQTATGPLDFGLSLNGAAPVTISVPGANWSGLGGGSALQGAILAAINSEPTFAGKFSVAVSGGNGSPLRVSLSTVDPADRFATSDVVGNDGNDLLFEGTTLSSVIPVAAQNQSATAEIAVRMRLDGGAWTTASIPGADWSGAGGASALESALQAELPVGVRVRVTGGDGQPMHLAFSAEDSDQVLEIAAAYDGTTELPGVGLFASQVALDGSRTGGLPFFVGSGALGLGLNPDLVADPTRLAVGRSGSGAGDAAFALALAEAGTGATGPDALYQALLGTLGAASQQANRIAENQEYVTTQVDASKEAVAGVNLDEEMIAMVQYQHAYAASARFLNAVNEMLDVLLNQVGR